MLARPFFKDLVSPIPSNFQPYESLVGTPLLKQFPPFLFDCEKKMASIKSEGVDSRRINLDQILFFPPKTRFRLIRQIRTKNGSLEQEKEGGAETFARTTHWVKAEIVISKYSH